jgi:DNA-directed RNA polymerase specialized sigma24 family protein
MPLRDAIQTELPFLRRYARTLTGSQSTGDAAVREMLEALIEAPEEFDRTAPAKLELFTIFHRLWDDKCLAPIQTSDGIVAALPIKARQALLLTTIEGFSPREAGHILKMEDGDIRDNIAEARQSIDSQLAARIMIVEDEPIIALHLKRIVESLDHEVTGIMRTRAEAVHHAAEAMPELILADISLADGSSGIDAVRDILAEQSVPVIFITAFPERLLTGERPEPTYLITKPFEPETVAATIWQALLVHREIPTSSAAHAA